MLLSFIFTSHFMHFGYAEIINTKYKKQLINKIQRLKMK